MLPSSMWSLVRPRQLRRVRVRLWRALDRREVRRAIVRPSVRAPRPVQQRNLRVHSGMERQALHHWWVGEKGTAPLVSWREGHCTIGELERRSLPHWWVGKKVPAPLVSWKEGHCTIGELEIGSLHHWWVGKKYNFKKKTLLVVPFPTVQVYPINPSKNNFCLFVVTVADQLIFISLLLDSRLRQQLFGPWPLHHERGRVQLPVLGRLDRPRLFRPTRNPMRWHARQWWGYECMNF